MNTNDICPFCNSRLKHDDYFSAKHCPNFSCDKKFYQFSSKFHFCLKAKNDVNYYIECNQLTNMITFIKAFKSRMYKIEGVLDLFQKENIDKMQKIVDKLEANASFI